MRFSNYRCQKSFFFPAKAWSTLQWKSECLGRTAPQRPFQTPLYPMFREITSSIKITGRLRRKGLQFHHPVSTQFCVIWEDLKNYPTYWAPKETFYNQCWKLRTYFINPWLHVVPLCLKPPFLASKNRILSEKKTLLVQFSCFNPSLEFPFFSNFIWQQWKFVIFTTTKEIPKGFKLRQFWWDSNEVLPRTVLRMSKRTWVEQDCCHQSENYTVANWVSHLQARKRK